nr:hypothetical protein [Tanacetum cinerariifolium]
MDSNFTNENDPWEYSLDIDDSDLHLTHVMRSSSSAHVEPSPYTPNPVTIILGPAGVVQLSNSICVEPSSSTPNPVRIIPGPAGLVQRAKLLKKIAINYVNAFGGTVIGYLGDIDNFLKKRKLEQVVAIVKSCSSNALGDINVTLKDISGTVPGTIHYKVLDVGSYEKDITILRRRQDRDGVKLGLLKDLLCHARDETHERQLELDALDSHIVWLLSMMQSLGLPNSLGHSFAVVALLPTDVSSRTCVAGDFMVSAADSASNGFVTGYKTASKSGTNVCASGLKHVTVVVAVPSLIIALKQYLFVEAMTLFLVCSNSGLL